MAELAAALEALDGRVDGLEGTDANHEGRLADLEDDTWATEAALTDAESALQGQLDEQAASLVSLDGRMGDAESRITTIEADYLTSTDLLNYATMDWVAGRGFASEFDLDLIDGRVSFIEADYLTSADLVGVATETWVEGQGFGLDADFDLVEGRVEALEDELGALDLSSYVQLIDTDTTIAVTTSTELSEAIADLDGYLIAADATVTIELAAGTYAFSTPLYFSHPSGDRVAIQGADATTTILYFPSSDGLVVEGGATLGYVSDVTVMGADASGQDGVVVTDGSALGLGVVTVRNFGGSCVLADANSLIMADEGLVVSECGVYGVLARNMSFANVGGATVSNCDSIGISADDGSNVFADGATSSSNFYYGFYAGGGGSMSAYDSFATNNGTAGYYVYKNAVIQARRSVSTGSTYAYGAAMYSFLDAASSTGTSSTSADYRTQGNSFIYASSAAGSTTSTASNDTTDWVYGK